MLKRDTMNAIKILFIATSHDQLGAINEKTGVWLETLAAPYYVFKEAGAELTMASPLGGPVPLDPKSRSIIMATYSTKRFLKDEEAMNFLAHTVLLDDVNPGDFDVVFLPGGHGTLWDIADNKIVKQLLESFSSNNKAIGAVSHGVSALVSLHNEKGGALVKDRQITGASNSEEKSAGLTDVLPFSLETQLISLGALYSKGDNYISYVVVEGNIITGQNSTSSKEVARKILSLLQFNKYVPRVHPVKTDTLS
jgi:putative intracellular protease/amidase